MSNEQAVSLPRTIKVPPATWEAAKARAGKMGVPLRQFIEEAMHAELAGLIEALRKLGVRAECQPNKVVRVPISDAVLDLARHGREQTGLPAILMLALCMARFAGRRRGGRKARA